MHSKEPLIYCTIGRMAALCPRSTLDYPLDMSRVSLRHALPCIPLSQLIRGSLSGWAGIHASHPHPSPPYGRGGEGWELPNLNVGNPVFITNPLQTI